MYTIKSPITVGDVPGFFGGDDRPLVVQMMETCVLKDGKPIGKAGVQLMPLDVATKIAAELVKASGLGGEGK